MSGEKDLQKLLAGLQPHLHEGEYVFVSLQDTAKIDRQDILCEFREGEGITLVLPRKAADAHGLSYDFVAAWITLRVHSSLQAVGLTASVGTALAENQISCNVVAAYYHDHIFVDLKDTDRAMRVLKGLSGKSTKYR